MHNLAEISVIQNLEPIQGKDRIELAAVSNYKSIVQKGEFKVGDRCIYVFYDACLPVKPEFEFLRKRCYNAKFNVFRIRPMKMGGVISEGLVLPISILPKDKRDLKVGSVLDDILEIKNYEDLSSDEKPRQAVISKRWQKLIKYSFFKRIYYFFHKDYKKVPYPCPKSDEENIEKVWDGIKNSKEIFYVSEKVEGCSSTYLLHKNRLLSFSHNFYNNGGCWKEVAKIYKMKEQLKKVNKRFDCEIAIQGEICGPDIQKNIYKFDTYHFFLFGAYEVKSGRRLNNSELDTISSITGLPRVPFLGSYGILPSLDDMLKNCEGKSVVNTEVPREGLVWRTEKGDIHFKCKSRPYKVWFEEFSTRI